MKYLTASELKGVQQLLESLNATLGMDITIGNAEIVDANGDVSGSIGITDSGEYGLILDSMPDDDFGL